jgi:RNA polymerase sigma factor (sigma-70 family)
MDMPDSGDDFASGCGTVSADLLARVRGGDEGAWQVFVERLFPLVARIVRAYAPRQLGHEDWCQEVFLRLWDRLEQYRAGAPLEHWVAKLSVRVCLDQLRRLPPRRPLQWSELSAEEAAVLHDSLTSREATSVEAQIAARELTNKLLASLPAEESVLLRMLEMEDRSVVEIAEVFGWSTGQVKTRAHRARLKLMQHLKEISGDKDRE